MGRERGEGPSKKDGWIQQKIQKLMIGWGEYYLELESNCLIVSLVLLKFLRWQQHHFCLFEFVLVCLWIYCAPRKKSYTVLPEGTDIHIQQHNHQKDLNICLSLYYYDKVIGEVALGNSYWLLISDNVWAIFSLRDYQLITFVILLTDCFH